MSFIKYDEILQSIGIMQLINTNLIWKINQNAKKKQKKKSDKWV